MPKLKLRGNDVVIVPGSGQADMGKETGLLPFGGTATVLSSNATLTTGGIYQLSQSTGNAVTASLPDPSNNMGVRYHIINAVGQNHVTASSGDNTDNIGNLAGVSVPDMDGYARFVFEDDVASFVVESNGTWWQVLAVSSGSHSYFQDS